MIESTDLHMINVNIDKLSGCCPYGFWFDAAESLAGAGQAYES